MTELIEETHEFCEIVNAFPSLQERLEVLFNVSNLIDGVSIYDYFKQRDYDDEEISLIVNKLNRDVKYFLKKGEYPKARKVAIGHEPISLEEE